MQIVLRKLSGDMEMFYNQIVVMDIQPYTFTKIIELCP